MKIEMLNVSFTLITPSHELERRHMSFGMARASQIEKADYKTLVRGTNRFAHERPLPTEKEAQAAFDVLVRLLGQ